MLASIACAVLLLIANSTAITLQPSLAGTHIANSSVGYLSLTTYFEYEISALLRFNTFLRSAITSPVTTVPVAFVAVVDDCVVLVALEVLAC